MLEIILLLKRLINLAVSIYTFIIIARAIISWVSPDPYNPIVRTLYRLTEPVLYPIRKFMFKLTGYIAIDFSPFIAIILIQIARALLFRILNVFINF